MTDTRIDRRFKSLAEKNEKGFVAYLTAGDPHIDATLKNVLLLEEIGADIIELGIPFSDPLADGVANQRAAERALAAGTKLDDVIELVKRIRERSDIPLLFFSYMNPLVAHGFEPVVQRACEAGVDGYLMVDISMEEAAPYRDILHSHNMNHIVLVTPTTPESRVKDLVQSGSGFVYCVSRAGVTGEQAELQKDAQSVLELTAKYSDLPRALGFGISSPEQSSAYAAMSESVVVGSAIVNTLHQCGDTNEGRKKAAETLKPLVDACKGA